MVIGIRRAKRNYYEFMLKQIDMILEELAAVLESEGEAAIELKMIEMTLPEKQTRKNQRYIKR